MTEVIFVKQKHIIAGLLMSEPILIPMLCLAQGNIHHFLAIPAEELTPGIVERALLDWYYLYENTTDGTHADIVDYPIL